MRFRPSLATGSGAATRRRSRFGTAPRRSGVTRARHALLRGLAATLLCVQLLSVQLLSHGQAQQAPPAPSEAKPAAVGQAGEGNGAVGGEGGDQAPALSVAALAKQKLPSIVVINSTGRDGKQRGVGTGFAIAPDLIVTNLHVIGEGRDFEVETSSRQRLAVRAIHAFDRFFDLAVVRVEADDLPPLELAPPQQPLDSGAPVVVIGNPLGLKHSVVSGVLSSIREVENRRMLQLAIPIEPGNSGGPVLDRQGRVHGIVTMKSLVTDNLGFAIPADDLRKLLQQPNSVPMDRWRTIGALDPKRWQTRFGAQWRQRGGQIEVRGSGRGFGGRSLCLQVARPPKQVFEAEVTVKLADEGGAAGLVFQADGGDRHYGFYPSNGSIRVTRFEGPDVFSWRVLHDQPSPHYRAGQWNHLRVRVDGQRILGFLNGHQIVELNESALPFGQVGLAKFRDTVAEFKQFRMAEKLAPLGAAAENRQEIQRAVDQLGRLARIKDGALAPLVDQPASVTLIRERARELERQVAELRQVARDVQVRQVVAQFQQVLDAGVAGAAGEAQVAGEDTAAPGKASGNAPATDRAPRAETPFDLLRAALLIAQLDEEEIDVDAYVAQVERMAEEMRQRFQVAETPGKKPVAGAQPVAPQSPKQPAAPEEAAPEKATTEEATAEKAAAEKAAAGKAEEAATEKAATEKAEKAAAADQTGSGQGAAPPSDADKGEEAAGAGKAGAGKAVAEARRRLAIMNRYLFEENGFHGSRHEYYHRANSYLNRVIDDRVGLPITLSLLYIELARRIGLHVEGVGMPGHFLVRFRPPGGPPELIDVFDGGKRLSDQDVQRMGLEFAGREVTDEDLRTAQPRAMLERMLNNLLGVAQKDGDREAMLGYLEALVALREDSIQWRGMRAVVRFETGRHTAALADLDWILEQNPPGIDLRQIEQMRRYFQQRMEAGQP